MRDYNRIPRLLAKLGKLWGHHPDQRLGQLLINLHKNAQFFYTEDETDSPGASKPSWEDLIDRALDGKDGWDR